MSNQLNYRGIEKIDSNKITIDGAAMASKKTRIIEIHENDTIKKYTLRRTAKGRYLMN